MNLFDILGPVMVGPSSSHTAGAARIGAMARTLLGSRPVQAEIGLHGSFAETGPGHGTDRALVAGLLGMKPDDLRIPQSFEVAAELAERVRRKLGADLGVGITGLAGPDGDGVHEVGTVFLSLSDGKRTWVREKRIVNRDRSTVRLYACQNVFDMIRRYLSGLPVEQERSDI